MQFASDLLILEEDEGRRQVLETIFKFLGLRCQSGSVEDCLSYFDADNAKVDICVAGAGCGDIAALMERHADTAFLIFAPKEDAKWSAHANFMGCLDGEPDYEHLMSLLHFCQSFRTMRKLSARSGQGAARVMKMLVGQTPAMVQVRRLIEQVAPTDANVLILGESGTGKEVVARAVHELSLRHGRQFVPVNCGAIPGELLESELFGHEKGAFTGACSTHEGRFELAAGGTLFPDEIGDMPQPMQVKLLRVLQERKFSRVGSNKELTADVRVIAATHQNLEKMVAEGTFREDLFYRLNVFPIETPPLRQRTDDIPLLIQEIVNRQSSERQVSIRFTQAAMLELMQNEWKGNVRELGNLVERLLILHPNEIIDSADLPPKYRGGKTESDPQAERQALLDSFSTDDMNEVAAGLPGMELIEDDNRPIKLPPLPIIEGEEDMAQAFAPTLGEDGVNLKDMVSNIEISLIRQALQQSSGVVAKASEILGLRRTTLVEKMKKYGISAQG